jgi:PBS lyase HEAT-like repeat
MTPTQRQLCMRLVIEPNGRSSLSPADFELAFPSCLQNGRVSSALITDTLRTKDVADLQCLLIVGFNFGFDYRVAPALRELLQKNWHPCHEDIVSALEDIGDADAVAALLHMTKWTPDYLKFDEGRALAVKAIWALGKIPGEASTAALRELSQSSDEILRNNAVHQINKRGEPAWGN